ncbi:MAG: CotH kinase family protein [Marinifilaceae bacterium]
MKNYLLPTLLSFVMFFSCSEDINIPLSADKEILKFEITQELNAEAINGKVSCTLTDSLIIINTEHELLNTNLIATFSYLGKMVTVKGKEQISGTTSNDFNEDVIYEVIAENGETRRYIAHIAKKRNSFLSFSFRQEDNPGVFEIAPQCIVTDTLIIVELDHSIESYNLIPSFTHNGEGVYVNGKQQISGNSINNFEKDVVYTIVAEDGTPKRYTVRFEKSQTEFTSFGFTREMNSIVDDVIITEFGTDTIDIVLKGVTRNLIAEYTTTAAGVKVGEITQESGKTPNAFGQLLTYTLISKQGIQRTKFVRVRLVNLTPSISIDVENGAEITSKDTYLNATVTIDGKGAYDNYTGTTRVKGRGNSTWGYPKKPYRLKLDNKAKLLGLGAEKDWVLLANHIDPTLMLNAVAMKTGQMLEVPFTNHIVSVDLTINGEYRGNYMFTEQVEISDTRVNIDSKKGFLLELDTYYDEDYKFKSDYYKLPVMVKDPDLSSAADLEPIKEYFHQFEALVADNSFPDNSYTEYFDINILVKYLIVYNLCLNQEINHPKSTYMYKDVSGKLTMGPIWDFDWAFSYEEGNKHFVKYDTPLFGDNSKIGAKFFNRFFEDPKVRELYKSEWMNFKNNVDQLYMYLDDYATTSEISFENNFKKWNPTLDNKQRIKDLISWLKKRVTYIDSEVSRM